MKKWNVICYWEMAATVEVEAETPEEAAEKVYNSDRPLPDEGQYCDGSWDVSWDCVTPA